MDEKIRKSVLKEKGSYLITGGMGELGLVFARYLAERTRGSVLLTGRREADEQIKRKLDDLRKINPNVYYLAADVAKRESVEALAWEARKLCGQLDGIIHAAGVHGDAFFIKKGENDFERVLSVKVEGTRWLDEVFADEPLSFFVLFSSISAVLGNVGQTDYSYANAFMDAYAEKREALRREGKRFGRSVSINWPLWDRGMSMDKEARAAVEKQMGVLTGEEGIRAFEDALMQPSPRFIVLKAREDEAEKLLGLSEKQDTAPEKADQAEDSVKDGDVSSELQNRVKTFLKNLLSEQTGIPANQISDQKSFENYGIDSVIIMALTGRLEEKIGQVAKTLFFEYENVEDLSRFLASAKKAEFERLFGVNATEKKPAKIAPSSAQPVNRSWFTDAPRRPASDAPKHAQDADDMAIIGISGRYPGAGNLNAFWDNLKNGKDCVTEIPAHRWRHESYDGPKGVTGKSYSKWGGFIDDIEMFDPLFFRIPPIEAEFMDPQERVLLETAWEAVEDAGYTPESLKDEKVGVYTGTMYTQYQLYDTKQYGGKIRGLSKLSSIANRISYLLNFKGPSIGMDTMCSSALTALCLACENIRSGLATMAIVGGVNLNLHPDKYVSLCLQNFLSTDGRCRSFGEGGDGYVPGEGAGAVVIKPLRRAEADGDQIYGVIRGIRMNAGGKTSGYTVPSVQAQRDLIRETLDEAHIDAGTVAVIEAHGTGTALGDPIEIEALTQAFHSDHVPAGHCAIGSVKSNIGHLESASGMAALAKVLLEMRHGQLAPTLHSEKPNPFISFDQTPFYLQHELSPWTRFKENGREIPRRAGISSFGAGGANVHLIVEEYRDRREKANGEGEQLIILSARNEERLKAYAEKLLVFLNALETDDAPASEPAPRKDDPRTGIAMEALSAVLAVPSSAFSSDDGLNDIGVDRYLAEQIAGKLSESAMVPLNAEDVLKCRTVSDLGNLLKNPQEEDKQSGASASRAAAEKEEAGPSLAEIAYTLQTGREAMETRLAIVAGDRETLIKALKDYLAGEENDRVRTGSVREMGNRFDRLFASRDFTNYLVTELKQGKLEEAADFFVLGADIPWKDVYGDRHPARVSLPPYPFARQRCWILPDDGSGCLCPDTEEIETAAHEAPPAAKEKEKGKTPVQDAPKEELSPKQKKELVTEWLRDAFAAVLKLPKDEISADSSYEAYGIDSIYIARLNQYLGSFYRDIPSTLFFTYKNISQLAGYLLKEHPLDTDAVLRGAGLLGAEAASLPQGSEEKPAAASVPENTAVHPVSAPSEASEDGIAVIGISGRYPQAEDLDAFYRNLMEGKDCITEIPAERWDWRDYPDIKCRWGGFLRGADEFDPQFFGIAPYMAYFMDPQERLFLEAVWNCMEDAGYTPSALENPQEMDRRGRVAVYAGVSFDEYGLYGAEDLARGKTTSLNSQIYSVANRVSYLFNFGGPSMSVDTACSSSLYALHLACCSIQNGDADLAIAGGVNLSLHPSKYITLDWGKFLASDGHCHTFGQDGDGYVPGEGVGAVLLKPLKKAKEDHDHIYAVIRGTAVNHGGRTYGYSVPNPVAQTEVIDRALRKAKVDPRTISYVEAHGTGTSLGDPIEISALTEAYRKYTKDSGFCAIGSVKSNIGHLEAAAGISQLTKVILQLQHQELVPSRLNADGFNPNIDFGKTPFRVQLEKAPWKRPVVSGCEQPRRAGISSFGVGGVNVHVIVEEEEEKANLRPAMEGRVVIPCSGRSQKALTRSLEALAEFIRSGNPLPDLRDAAFTLTNGRTWHACRTALVVSGWAELEEKISAVLDGKTVPGVWTGKASENDRPLQGPSADPNQTPEQMAEAWVSGGALTFRCEEANFVPYRVSLPGYRFEREQYWMYSKEAKAAAAVETSNPSDTEPQALDTGILSGLRQAWPDDRKGILVGFLKQMFAGLLGFREGQTPDTEEGFFSMGMESIMTRQAQQIIGDHLNVNLEEQDFFTYPNISELADYLLSRVPLEGNAEEKREDEMGSRHREWIETESLRFTGSLGRGNVSMIALGAQIETALKERLAPDVLANVSQYEYPSELAKEENPFIDKLVYLGGQADWEKEIGPALQKALSGKSRTVSFVYLYPLAEAENGAEPEILRKLKQEDSRFHYKTVGYCPDEQGPEALAEILANEVRTGCHDEAIRYLKGRRELYAEMEEEPNTGSDAAAQPEEPDLDKMSEDELAELLKKEMGLI